MMKFLGGLESSEVNWTYLQVFPVIHMNPQQVFSKSVRAHSIVGA